MKWSFSIGRLFGSELRIHATFFLLLAWIGWEGYARAGAHAALMSVLFVLALFACVVAHEYGHALTARRYGIRTVDITLLPIGGLARLERMPEQPLREITVALAGPAVNVVIWALLSLVTGPATMLGDVTDIPGWRAFFAQLAALNLFLAVFNMLPAFPMDGGRVLRALLSIWTDRVRATRIAARAGQAVAVGFALLGLFWGNVILILIAGFIFLAANAESNDATARRVSRRFRARDAMITEYEALHPDDSLQLAANSLIRTTQHEFPVLDGEGHILGFLERNALFSALDQGSAAQVVGAAMTRDIVTVPLDEGLERVLERLRDSPSGLVAVVGRNGRFKGYISRENIGELLMVHRRGPD
ncbi:site-2 protease family protein [Pontibaca methylaminivorans]|uniref:site-2 protease family protein n=1 Tax=Pontibaca methylaminivorans TaxID=515897 RepID=UPI002FD9916D